MEYERVARRALESAFAQLPIVSVLGPRQSGKTTLCRAFLPNATYVNLEDPNVRNRAAEDLSGFVSALAVPAILDEVQRLPEILSAVQVESDRRNVPGQYLVTGSQQFNLSQSISQSLAGRTAIIKLLPLSLEERISSGDSPTSYEAIFSGGYPRIVSGGLNPSTTLGDYIETYVERDVRQLTNIQDLQKFRTFLRLVAGRVGQLVNYESLAGDTGISPKTAQHWLSILEAGFVTFVLPPFFKNFSKRLIRTPKIYFYDTGVCAALLGRILCGAVYSKI
jgi:predicted AAA+ superfamily ATPase